MRNNVVISLSVLAVVTAVGGCTRPGPAQDLAQPFDPYEKTNRANHALNRAVDRALLRPAGKGYVAVIPQPVQAGVSNFAANLALPGAIANTLLQGRLGEAGQNSLRFALNSTIGIGGLFDASSQFGLYEADADFGETLAVWGAEEGAYIELPLLGPSTERDAVGKLVDLFTNPLSYMVQSPEKYYGTAASVASRLGDRGAYADAIDSVLYNSADSYAQLRMIYLQNRRFELGEAAPDTGVDPFALDTEGF